jgi:hypothetical protein
LFNVLAMVAEFEGDLIRMRTREGMAVAKAKGRLRGKQAKLSPRRKPTSSHCTALASTPPSNSPSCSASPAPPSTARSPAQVTCNNPAGLIRDVAAWCVDRLSAPSN